MEFSPILDLATYNGRINIADPPNADARFEMFEKVAVRNKASVYSNAMLNEWEPNVLAQVYFSAENAQIIQNGLKAGVYERSGGEYILPNQNADALKIIMRSIYMHHAKHLDTNITQQIEKLNAMVLDFAIPQCYSEAIAYTKYVQDQSTLVVPLARAPQTDRDYKQLEMPSRF